MIDVIKKEILYDLTEAIKILEKKETEDVEKLKELSDHAIEDVAVHKNLDIISITVLIYSIYKIVRTLGDKEYRVLLEGLKLAKKHLERDNLHHYNNNIKYLFKIVQDYNAKVRIHLNDVMHAARIKKGTALLEKGLSIGQAAGLMRLSNWDLQQYASKTSLLEEHSESIPAKKRMSMALRIFSK